MRFGYFVPQGWRLDLVDIEPTEHWSVMSGLATRADEGDWDSIWVYDHFHTVPEPTAEATHEAWSLVSAYAATTSNVEIGQMCTAMAYRNPAYLAKVAATADLISGGRVQMGIGAGWYEHEWRAYGYGFPSAGERLGRLAEGVDIMRQAWSTGKATLDGKYYTVDGAIASPQPAAGKLPLWIAGGGEKKTLRIAAEHADYTNFDGTPETFAHKSEILQQHCADLGRDFDSIVRSANFNVVVAETEAEVEKQLVALEEDLKRFVSADAAAGMVANVRASQTVGTPEQIVENLSRVKDLGLEYAIFYIPGIAKDTTALDLLESQVLPALR
ncbi:LLM class F420-dependent oxidoreductase [Gordonia soli]|uniref:Putative oxidoreductase n=1 Tax=Gordonia soli NBRC 108243 TaxID=1223545 RepID=M0QIH1_9ACTN|nr:LLM class F420-dependent oxidoreductase [Gordonia soli]GAC68343.1 putative oxidoreductase [Gordonia soli NBRC 108243]